VDRRTLVSLTLGLLSVACAVGAFETEAGQSPLSIEPLVDAGGRGQLQGFVSDSKTGQPIAGALVILQCNCLEGQRELQTNPEGLYSFRDLPPGKYTVQALAGQGNVSRIVDLAPDIRVRADIRLDPRNTFVIT
jgi:hypothetical protein